MKTTRGHEMGENRFQKLVKHGTREELKFEDEGRRDERARRNLDFFWTGETIVKG